MASWIPNFKLAWKLICKNAVTAKHWWTEPETLFSLSPMSGRLNSLQVSPNACDRASRKSVHKLRLIAAN
jgi:hypothetical protein